MPELPEVETLARTLAARLAGRTIESLRIVGISALKTVRPRPADLAGAAVSGVTRRGKFVVIATTAGDIAFHLSRAGWVRWYDEVPRSVPGPRSNIAARLTVDGGAGFDITEAGHEKRVAIHIVERPEDVPRIAHLGIDALDPELTVARLGDILRTAGRAHLKTVLADQSVIAGIGNAYSDEILHIARLAPFAPSAGASDGDVSRLWSSMRTVLADAIAALDGVAFDELKDAKRSGMRVHGRGGDPCPVCADTIRSVELGGRSFQYCPGCQTNGRIYADRRLSKLGITPGRAAPPR